MITICEECGKKYRIDPTKITGKDATFKCKACGHLITARKPAPLTEARIDDQPLPSGPPILNAVEASKEEPAAPPPGSEETGKEKKRPAFASPAKIRFGLTAKLFTMMIIVSLVPLSMFWGIGLKQTKERMQNDAKQHTNRISINIARNVEGWLDKNARILKTLANMADIISMDRRRQQSVLEAIRKGYPWIYLTFTIDTDGINIARNDGGSLRDYSDTQYFKDIMAGKSIAWQTTLDESTKKPVLILATPIVRYDEVVGAVANAISLDDLSNQLIVWVGDDTEIAFVVDENGKVITHKNKRFILQQKNLRQHPLIAAYRNGQRGSISYNDQEGTSILGHVRGTVLGWIIAIQQEEKEAFDIIDQVLSNAYFLLGVTVVFVFIIAWFSGRALSRPIVKLTDAADRISIGELDVDIDTKREDEIGDLAEAIARMQDSIRLSIERLRQRR